MTRSLCFNFYFFNRPISFENFKALSVVHGMKIFWLSSALKPFMPSDLNYCFKLLIRIIHYGILAWAKDDHKDNFYYPSFTLCIYD